MLIDRLAQAEFLELAVTFLRVEMSLSWVVMGWGGKCVPYVLMGWKSSLATDLNGMVLACALRGVGWVGKGLVLGWDRTGAPASISSMLSLRSTCDKHAEVVPDIPVWKARWFLHLPMDRSW